jgi:hypothetical protein
LPELFQFCHQFLPWDFMVQGEIDVFHVFE